MWQQSDCNIKNATRQNPSGCLSDLYPFVITNYTNISIRSLQSPAIDDNGGGNSMAFYNVQTGDVPVLKRLADQFSMSDNFHQSVMGGTGANHVMLGTGDASFWSDGNGNPTTPPSHIANPDPLPGTDDVLYRGPRFRRQLHRVRRSVPARHQADPGLPAISPLSIPIRIASRTTST